MTSASARVRALCERALGQLGEGRARAELEQVRAGLDGPLRVAVAGPVKAGKSTLVNALLEQKIAPTAASECTRVVTWFEDGYLERVTLRLRGGGERELYLTGDGKLPEELGEAPETVESLRVTLSNAALKDMTIIDTPGLASANEELSRSSESLLGPGVQDGPAQVDALVYVFTQDARAETARALSAFRSNMSGMRASAINTIGVLGKADMVGTGRNDPLGQAAQLAGQLQGSLNALVGEVVPVAGLLAETAATSLRASDAHSLTQLAGAGSESRKRMLLSVDRFQQFDSPVTPEQRRRLADLLGLFGIAECLRLIDEGSRSNAALSDALRELSGVDTLRERLLSSFGRHADVLKADRALADLGRLAYSRAEGGDAGVLQRLRGELDDLQLEPEMHRLKEVWALQEAATIPDELGEDMTGDLRQVVMAETLEGKLGLPPGSEEAELRHAAAQRAGRWQAFSGSLNTTPTASRIGRVAYRSYVNLWERLSPAKAAR